MLPIWHFPDMGLDPISVTPIITSKAQGGCQETHFNSQCSQGYLLQVLCKNAMFKIGILLFTKN